MITTTDWPGNGPLIPQPGFRPPPFSPPSPPPRDSRTWGRGQIPDQAAEARRGTSGLGMCARTMNGETGGLGSPGTADTEAQRKREGREERERERERGTTTIPEQYTATLTGADTRGPACGGSATPDADTRSTEARADAGGRRTNTDTAGWKDAGADTQRPRR